MGEVITRFLSICIITILAGYASQLYFGSIVEAETERNRTRVEVHDFLDVKAKTHRLSGIIMLPTKCHSLSIKTKELAPGKYHVYFSTFGDVHGCAQEPHAVPFRTIVNAPLVGVEFTASLDWHDMDFILVSSAHSTK
ncbi:MAG: hypothetical protein WAZ27_05260 [Minisyncoccia bacterium]